MHFHVLDVWRRDTKVVDALKDERCYYVCVGSEALLPVFDRGRRESERSPPTCPNGTLWLATVGPGRMRAALDG